ncbi:uncharacterized protein LOC144878575 [Branchiostoma floridae x Branchiostoma japonicum]
MKTFTVGLLLTCALVTLVLLQGVSGRRGRGGGGFRFRSSSSVRRSGGSSFRARIVPPLLLASSRRRRQSASSSSLGAQQCQRCTAAYICQDPSTATFMTGTSTSPGAQEVSICRNGTAACNYGKCSINYLWSNRTITDFPDGVNATTSDPEVGII